jgi:hypothetical protein
MLGPILRRRGVDRARGDDARVVADRALLHAVQTGVLPVAPPDLEGARISAAYRMAGPSGGTIGGDFYVFVPFEDGTIGLGVGDVAGHGPAAVAAMANVRLTLRAIASVTPDPIVTLSRTEFVLRRTGTLDFLTVLYGVLDPAKGTWTQVNAGHCPPIRRRPDGSTRVLAGESCTALGVFEEASTFRSSQTIVEPGDILVLYTDGLVECRDAPIDEGIERIRGIVGRYDDPATLTTALMDTVGPEPLDDVAIVVVQVGDVAQGVPPLPPESPGRRYLRRATRVHARAARDGELVQTPLCTWVATNQDWIMTTQTGDRHLIPYRTFRELYVDDDTRPLEDDQGDDPSARRWFAPRADSVPAARHFVRSWLRDIGGSVDAQAIELLTTELATNAVVHAGTTFAVEVEASDSTVRIGVHDASHDLVRLLAPTAPATGGRGLSIVASLAETWGCDLLPSGKTVWFEMERTPL